MNQKPLIKELENLKHVYVVEKKYRPYRSVGTKFCSTKCQSLYEYNEYINRWKNGLETGIRGKCDISNHIRRYLFEKYNCSCEICGWGKKNEYTNKIPLQIHHVDGNCINNTEDNLMLLCPNCHSLTNTFGNLNKNSKRNNRNKK